jgi:hypothetical protein
MGPFPEKGQLLKNLLTQLKQNPNLSDFQIRTLSLWETFKNKLNKNSLPKADFYVTAFMDGNFWKNPKYTGGELYALIEIKNTKNEVTTIEDSFMDTNNINNVLPTLITKLLPKITETLLK